MERPSYWIFNREVANTLESVPEVDSEIVSWCNVDTDVPSRFTIATGIAWFDGAILPIVWDQEKDKEYTEIDSIPWNGPHVDFCKEEKTEQYIADCICIKSYCRNLLLTISNEITNSEV